jgi:EAL and modified HD-GYP domain-containing signal transduction protein
MLATDKPSELVLLSLVRARFSEQLAQMSHVGHPTQAFLMGMFSVLDALIDRPLDEAVRSVELGSQITEALLGTAPDGNLLACLHRLIRGYELADWDQVEALSQTCGIPPAQIAESYCESTVWAGRVIQAAGN